MKQIDHNKWAKKTLKFLVNHVKKFSGGYKHITYGELAKRIKYPKPHIGNLFGSNIGKTLGAMGHMFDDITIDGWQGPVPMIQSLVVNQNKKLPSDGLKEFSKTYPLLSDEKKKDFTINEYEKIFSFGERWDVVLKKLKITPAWKKNVRKKQQQTKRLYNSYGSEGSPEHRKLRDHIAANPFAIGLQVSSPGIVEYPIKSGDSIDVVFEDANTIVAIEVKSIRSGFDDMERGVFQCVKYSSVLNAELKILKDSRKVSTKLVVENKPNNNIRKIARLLNIEIIEYKVNE